MNSKTASGVAALASVLRRSPPETMFTVIPSGPNSTAAVRSGKGEPLGGRIVMVGNHRVLEQVGSNMNEPTEPCGLHGLRGFLDQVCPLDGGGEMGSSSSHFMAAEAFERLH